MKPLALTLAALLLTLAGCAAPKTDLKATCDALGPVMAEFGEESPTSERYAAVLPKVRAIADAAQPEVANLIKVLAVPIERGAGGDSTAWAQLAGASVALVAACRQSGSTAYAVASASPSASAPAEVRNAYVDVRVELDSDAMFAVDDLAEGDDCIPAAEFDDLAGDASVSVRDASGEVVGVEDLPQLRLAVVEGGDSLDEAYCAAKVGVVGVPTGGGFYSVRVGSHEVDMTEAELFGDAVVTLGSVPE